MNPPVFLQNPYHAWHFSTVENWATYDLPQGAKFLTMNSPDVTHDRKWIVTRLRVGTHFNPALKRDERVYFAEQTWRYDSMPDVQVIWAKDKVA